MPLGALDQASRDLYSLIGRVYASPSLVVQIVKRLPTMWETQVRFLGQKDPLEKELATHSITLAWKTPWMEEHGRLQAMGSQRVGHDGVTSHALLLNCLEAITEAGPTPSTLHKNMGVKSLSGECNWRERDKP